MSIRLKINGEDRVYHGDPRDSLLTVLRRDLRLTGAKDVCGEGFCGACMVIENGTAVPACLRPVGLLEDAEITTIEGLSPLSEPSPLQAAFARHDVVQCGMCFPGMVMTLTSLLAENPSPDRTEVKAALVGNLCRCTGYERIVDAVMSLQEQEHAQ
ncbi:(2Fe-2S)-binding protein (plasmid) [Sulfitobacter alexandrii]|uniref:(2Fe-2S)-binding protein n=1 Tax=Sulfitobacter alexandrii TaxID=1917485 RepID=A0A1J0WMU9_9RHOB|nr:(2Fe-2S)-binding protein [Sulfitobacter alexandrii]APE45589.1 (2Fe-2S)-binding protein [Sulfitobacter alexandrii]